MKRIESEVVRRINNKPSQLHEVMKYLSPNIQRIAKAHRPEFKNYEELKAWLIEHHVNELRIVKELQNRIASVVPTKEEDLEGFILHTRGVLANINEHCELYPKLRPALLSERNVAALIKFILGEVSRVTERNEIRQWLKQTWNPFKREMLAKDIPVTQEQKLTKMDEYLEEVLEIAKLMVQNEQRITSNQLSGPQRQQEQEESDDDNSKEGCDDEQSEAGSENEDERESEEEDAENGENFCEECIGCHGLFSVEDSEFDYNYDSYCNHNGYYNYNNDGWVCWGCYENDNSDEEE